jgi:uncharacterized membrane protein
MSACEPTSAVRAASQPCVQNVSEQERLLSLAGGGVLLAATLARQSLGSLLALAAGASLVYRGYTGYCGVYQALGMNSRREQGGVAAGQGERVTLTRHIQRDPEELYQFWRKLDNLPSVMQHLESVTELDGVSHWVARGPLGQTLKWEAQIINERPGELIAWESLPGSQVDTAGSVRFEEAEGGGTVLTVALKYNPPGGTAVAQAADWMGVGLESELESDLDEFQQRIAGLSASAPIATAGVSSAPLGLTATRTGRGPGTPAGGASLSPFEA